MPTTVQKFGFTSSTAGLVRGPLFAFAITRFTFKPLLFIAHSLLTVSTVVLCWRLTKISKSLTVPGFQYLGGVETQGEQQSGSMKIMGKTRRR